MAGKSVLKGDYGIKDERAKLMPKPHEENVSLNFSVPHDKPVPYMQRLKDYYLALGYGNPYRWAQYTEVPFTKMEKPLSDTNLGLVVTCAPFQPGKGDQGPGATYNAAAKFYQVYTESTEGEPDVRISHLGYDRNYTTAADVNTYFPLQQLKIAANEGFIGGLSRRLYGIPTNRSQVTTIEQDCADVLAKLTKDSVEAVILVAA